MLDASEEYLIPKVWTLDNERYPMMNNNQAVVSWTALAEKHGLSKLLAHCEDFMIRDFDDTLWHDEVLVADGVSRASLLRVLRALQHNNREMEINAKHHRDYHVEIPTLLEWQEEH